MAPDAKTKWVIDPNHSEVGFRIKHLAVSNVSGMFRKFGGTVESKGDDFSDASVYVSIEVGSIDTNNSERDGHLISAVFFNTDRFPAITFKGTMSKKGHELQLAGHLTMLETTRPVVLQVEQVGTGVDRLGGHRAGFEASGKINRRDFGLSFSMLTEAGSLIVGEEVNLHFDVQMVQQV